MAVPTIYAKRLKDAIKNELDTYAQEAAQEAEAWAQSPTAPDPLDPTSKSAKTIAAELAATGPLSLGEQLTRAQGFASVVGGGTAITVNQQQVGFSLTNAETGALDAVWQGIPVPAEIAAKYAGAVLRVKSTYQATAGFLTDKPLQANAIVRATRYDGATIGTSLGTVAVRSQAGTTLTLENLYTLGGQDRAIGNYLQVASTAVANAAHSVQLLSTTITVESVPAGRAFKAVDVIADWREYPLIGNIGPVYKEMSPSLALVGGATALPDAGGLNWGLTIPTGSTGAASSIFASLPMDVDSMGLLVNAWVEVRFQIDTSTTFSRALAPACRCRKADGSYLFLASQTYLSGSYQVSPTRKVFVFRVNLSTLTGAELTLEPYVLIAATSGATASTETLTISDASVRVVEPVSVLGAGTNSNIRTAADVNNRITFYRARSSALAMAVFGAGNTLSSIGFAGASQNGAVRTGYTLTIPAGQTGLSSQLQARRTYSGAVAGNAIRVQMSFNTSATFTRALNLNFQVNTAGGAVFRTPSVVRKNIGTRIYVTFDYVLQGDETGLWPYISLASTGATAVEEAITCDGFYFYELSAGNIGTANDKGASLVLQAAALAASSTGQYARTVTVKPSGGDFTHPKLALDAVTDASVSNRVKIAIYPGAYTGYAEWHTKDYVDLVGIGSRDEIIISYTNANDASASTISQTSTLWLDSNSKLESLTIRITNGRYAIHRETNGGRPGITSRIVNCVVEHLGNADAVNNTWAVGSQYAVGAGNSAGEQYLDADSVFRGPGGGYSYHTPNNGPYDVGTFVSLDGCEFVATTPGYADLSIKPIRPGAGDRCRIVGCTLDTILYDDAGWQVPEDTTSNRAGIAVSVQGCTPFVFTNSISGFPGEDYTPQITGRAS